MAKNHQKNIRNFRFWVRTLKK